MNSGQTLFSGQAQVAQKSWMIKTFPYIEKLQGSSVFQGKRKLLKNPEWKMYFNTVKIFKAILFSGQAQVAQQFWMIKNIYSNSEFRANFVFQGKRKLLKNPEW